jgi:hypothetical protein
MKSQNPSVSEESGKNEPSWRNPVSERSRFTSNVAELTAVTWTTGYRRNVSSKKSTTRATMGGRRRNDVHTDTIVLAIAKTPAIDTP